MRHHSFALYHYGIFIILAILIGGCSLFRRSGAPTPSREGPVQEGTSTPEPSNAPLSPAPVLPTTTAPTEAGLQPSVVSTALVVATQTITTSLTATPCALPDGWIIYTVQPADTLFRLAEQTESTVEELMRVNCLKNDVIKAYETTLYLPHRPSTQAGGFLPPSTAPGGGVGIPTQPPVDCNASLTCIIQGATLPIIAGGPGNPSSYTPCQLDHGGPWIDIHYGAIPALQQGDRTFLYACQFTASGELKAVATSDSGQQFSLNVYPKHPVPYLNIGNTLGVIDFPAIPDWPIGLYTVTVTIGSQSAKISGIRITPPNAVQSFILPVPVTGSPGDTLDIYYVNFPKDTKINVVLYSADPPEMRAEYDGLIPRLSWSTLIDHPLEVVGTPLAEPAGWAMEPLTFPPGAEINAYAVADQNWRGISLIWIK
jgi:hypothetical protein